MSNNKFKTGQRLVLAVEPSDLIVVGDGKLSYTDDLKSHNILHMQDYVGEFRGEALITLKETGTTQYLERLFKPAKRPRRTAERIATKPSFSHGNKV
jgi:hypothetical protein